MKSIKSVYKIGYGPSSSHTMGPSFAAADFMTKYPEADFIKVILYGSLAKTGKGHGTDRAIIDTLSDIKNEVNFNTSTPTDVHPNTVDFIAFKNDNEIGKKRYYSVGGGEIKTDDSKEISPIEVYKERNFTEIDE